MWKCDLQLRGLDGAAKGKVYTLDAGKMKLGRAHPGTPKVVGWVFIEDDTVSRLHAELHWDEEREGYRLFNRSETNPTIINNTPVTQADLSVGDQILVGLSLLVLEGIPDSSSQPTTRTRIKPAKRIDLPKKIDVVKSRPSPLEELTSKPAPSKMAALEELTSKPAPSKMAALEALISKPSPSKMAALDELTSKPAKHKMSALDELTTKPGHPKPAAKTIPLKPSALEEVSVKSAQQKPSVPPPVRPLFRAIPLEPAPTAPPLEPPSPPVAPLASPSFPEGHTKGVPELLRARTAKEEPKATTEAKRHEVARAPKPEPAAEPPKEEVVAPPPPRPDYYLEVLDSVEAGHRFPMVGEKIAIGGPPSLGAPAVTKGKWFDHEILFKDTSVPPRCLVLNWKEEEKGWEILRPTGGHLPVALKRKMDGLEWTTTLPVDAVGLLRAGDLVKVGKAIVRLSSGK